MADIKETNGHSATTNGVNGYKTEKVANGVRGKNTSGGPLGASSKPKKASKIANFKALRKASKRPLPTEMGDGQYRAVVNRPTLRDDLGVIGMNGEILLLDCSMRLLTISRDQDTDGYHQWEAQG